MDCDYVIARLRSHEPELRAAGVVRLFVFGSTARGDGRRIPMNQRPAHIG
jgi:predicted nucleotidyltransferase